MRQFEFEAKEAFRKVGLSIPRGRTAQSSDEAEEIAKELACPVILKVQVLAGGRGKAGGIKRAKTPKEARVIAGKLLGMEIHGHRVKRLLVEECLDIAKEIYVGITVDREKRKPVAICSGMGGVDIEKVAEEHPEKIARLTINPLMGMREFEARRLAKAAGFNGRELLNLSRIIMQLWRVFSDNDAELTEINPLIVTTDGKFMAADARLNVDDSSLFRHKSLMERLEKGVAELTELELRAREVGMTYVELKGDIGIIGNGAGLVMATMDAVHYYGGKPANFLDVGGGATADRMTQALDIVLSHPDVKGVFINILGGITRCDEMANGIVSSQKNLRQEVPMAIRLIGTREKEGAEILRKANIPFLETMDAAARLIVEKTSGGKPT
ncbi:MAG: ADP-forming succinate--CoA ligase subunit beta [Promethearchaeota archaeon]